IFEMPRACHEHAPVVANCTCHTPLLQSHWLSFDKIDHTIVRVISRRDKYNIILHVFWNQAA
ncbi:MAG: hypothetical protein ACKPKO_28060, partial [Candidatus Fonsibacter sp.]